MRTLFRVSSDTDTFSTWIYALIWTQTAHPYVAADTEERTHGPTVPNFLIKSLFLFYFRTKSILVAS